MSQVYRCPFKKPYKPPTITLGTPDAPLRCGEPIDALAEIVGALIRWREQHAAYDAAGDVLAATEQLKRATTGMVVANGLGACQPAQPRH